MKKILVTMLVLFCLILCFCGFAENSESVIEPWFEDGLGKFVPKPDTAIGENYTIGQYSFMNTESAFFAELDGITQEDFEKYASLAKQFGYNEQIESYGVAYAAVYKGKYKIALIYADLPSEDSVDYMIITLDIIS